MRPDFTARLGRPLTVALALSLLLKGSPAFAGAGAEEPAAEKNVVLHLKISDESSGLTLDARKSVPAGANAFDALRDIVNVRFITLTDFQAVEVTALCGVEETRGRGWALYLDGTKAYETKISHIRLSKDTLMEWKMEGPRR